MRRIVLEQSKRAHVGHIGSALSVVELLCAVYQSLSIHDPDDPDRDRFVLSKGHAALAQYAAFFLKGWLDQGQLDTFCADGGLLGVHPERPLRGVDFSTGSLGHGLSYGAGAALAARLQGSSRRVAVLASDAECDEGSLWEAVMFGAHHRLSQLIALVDCNGQQAMGFTKDVLDLSPLAGRWAAFGWEVHEVDGHDLGQLLDVLARLNTREGPPHVLVARTVFGRGVSFMENTIKWHYWPMSDDEYERAMAEVLTDGGLPS
jgi:transketolase